jgi:hypothetical protein
VPERLAGRSQASQEGPRACFSGVAHSWSARLQGPKRQQAPRDADGINLGLTLREAYLWRAEDVLAPRPTQERDRLGPAGVNFTLEVALHFAPAGGFHAKDLAESGVLEDYPDRRASQAGDVEKPADLSDRWAR